MFWARLSHEQEKFEKENWVSLFNKEFLQKQNLWKGRTTNHLRKAALGHQFYHCPSRHGSKIDTEIRTHQATSSAMILQRDVGHQQPAQTYFDRVRNHVIGKLDTASSALSSPE